MHIGLGPALLVGAGFFSAAQKGRSMKLHKIEQLLYEAIPRFREPHTLAADSDRKHWRLVTASPQPLGVAIGRQVPLAAEPQDRV